MSSKLFSVQYLISEHFNNRYVSLFPWVSMAEEKRCWVSKIFIESNGSIVFPIEKHFHFIVPKQY